MTADELASVTVEHLRHIRAQRITQQPSQLPFPFLPFASLHRIIPTAAILAATGAMASPISEKTAPPAKVGAGGTAAIGQNEGMTSKNAPKIVPIFQTGI